MGERFATTDVTNNNLRIMNHSFKPSLKIKAEGIQALSSGYRNRFEQSYAITDKHIFIWAAGTMKLGVLDFMKRQYEFVDHIGGMGITESLCHAVASKNEGRTIASLSTINTSGGICFINFWRRGSPNVTTKHVSTIYPTSKRSSNK